MRKKLCVYQPCRSDSRYSYKDYMKGVFFIPFPKPKTSFEKCQKWINWLSREDFPITRVNSDTYICSNHFVGKKGPTKMYPDPIHSHSDYISILKTQATIVPDNSGATDIRMNESEEKIIPIQDISSIFKKTSIQKINAVGLVPKPIDDLESMNFECVLHSFKPPLNWAVSQGKECHRIFRLKEGTDKVELAIKLDAESTASYDVQGKKLCNADLHSNLPTKISSLKILNDLVTFLNSCKLCPGNGEEKFLAIHESRTDKIGFLSELTGGLHSDNCLLLFNDERKSRCFFCARQRLSLQGTLSKIKKKTETSKTQFKNLNKGQLIQTLKNTKCSEGKLKTKIKRIRANMVKQIKKQGEILDDNDDGYLMEILQKSVHSGLYKNNPDISKLFLRTQLKMLKTHKNRRRWHPLIIQWCLFMYAKSPALYKTLNESGVLLLPSKSTLGRHSDNLGTTPGFHDEVFLKMKKDFLETTKREEHQEYFIIAMDEIKVEEDLVYKVDTGDIIGYTHLSNAEVQLSEYKSELYKDKPVATHILQFMIRGVTNGFKRPFAHFATNSLKAENLDSLLWEAVQKLELSGFKILGVVGDGASTNRKCFNLNCKDQEFKCTNPFNRERSIFFICDVPHLIKTVRNCLANSREGCNYRLMKVNGETLKWATIRDLYNLDMNRPGNFRKLNKLTSEHINLENRMKVKYATQVLSQSVANALKSEYGDECKELVRFVEIFNKWFDIMNVGQLSKGYHTRNPNIYPFQHINDPRLDWLKNDFLGYLDEWEEYVKTLDVKKEHKKKMLLSQETLSGLRQTTNAILEIIPFLLNKGAKFVLTAHLNQDPIEQLFSRHRQACESGSKPTVYQFSRNTQRLHKLEEGNIMLKSSGGNTESNN